MNPLLLSACLLAADPEMNADEKRFAAALDNAVMEGSFTIVGPRGERTSKDKYTIVGVAKGKGDRWTITSKIQYFAVDVQIPVPVRVEFVAGAAVLHLTDLALPGMSGKFRTRLVIDGDLYAGTWAHDKVGGHMWGRIVKADKAAAPKKVESKKAEAPKPAADPAK